MRVSDRVFFFQLVTFFISVWKNFSLAHHLWPPVEDSSLERNISLVSWSLIVSCDDDRYIRLEGIHCCKVSNNRQALSSLWNLVGSWSFSDSRQEAGSQRPFEDSGLILQLLSPLDSCPSPCLLTGKLLWAHSLIFRFVFSGIWTNLKK